MSDRRLVRGQVWYVKLDPTIGHEQAKTRPCLIISNDYFNQGRSGLVVVVPITSTNRKNPLHIEVNPPEGALFNTSYILCDQIRTISTKRLSKVLGMVSAETLYKIEYVLKVLLDI